MPPLIFQRSQNQPRHSADTLTNRYGHPITSNLAAGSSGAGSVFLDNLAAFIVAVNERVTSTPSPVEKADDRTEHEGGVVFG